MTVIALTVGAVVLVAVCAVVVGSLRWSRATGELRQGLTAAPTRAREVVTDEQLQGLPAPVARYFRHVLRPGQPLIVAARVAWHGEFRTGQDEQGWRPLEATQHFATGPPGFVWDACIRMAPLVSVRVRDSYVAGVGSMHAALLGLIPVVNQHGNPELNAGALQRYLAEAVWFPTALLPARSPTGVPRP